MEKVEKETLEQFWEYLGISGGPNYDIVRIMDIHNDCVTDPMEKMGFDYNIWIKGDQNRFWVWFKTGAEGDEFFFGDYKRESKIENNQILLASLQCVLQWLKEWKAEDIEKFKENMKNIPTTTMKEDAEK